MARDTFGMSPEEMDAYLGELLEREASESAAARGTTVEEELESTGYAAARAAASYTIHLIHANNQFIARYLLDHGVMPIGADAEPPSTDEQPAG